MKKGLFFYFLSFGFCCAYSQSVTNSSLNLFFDVNKYDLNNEHFMLIDSAMAGKKLTITCIKGFADTTGATSFNIELSRKRATAVYNYINDHHRTDSFVTVEYFGEQHAAEKNISYNRRVEICYSISIFHQEETPLKNNTTDTLEVTEKYEISNIYFIPDKAIVDPTSFFAVDDAAKYLKKFPRCKFEIVGHVNNALLPSEANTKALEPIRKLSEERAKTIYDLIIERGIPAESMTHKGVRNSQMVFKNPKNDEEKRKNMRVEILISCKK